MPEKKHMIKKYGVRRSPMQIIIAGFMALVAAFSLSFLVFKNYDLTVNFNEQNNYDYKIHTTENKYYDKIIEKDQQYITSIIDYIDLNPSYSFTADHNLNFIYTYKATGKLIVYDSSNDKNILFSKEYELLPATTEQINNFNEISVNKNLRINYHDYDNYSNEYKKNFEISGNDNFVVTFSVDLESRLGDNESPQKRSFEMDFIIPMTEKTISIATDIKNKDGSGQFVFDNQASRKVPLAGMAGFGALGLILLMIGTVKLIKNYQNTSQYHKWIKKLQNKHGNYIINVAKTVDEENYEIVYVVNFDDLLYKARLINKNISCIRDKKNNSTEFSIIEDGIIYKKVYKKSDKEFI